MISAEKLFFQLGSGKERKRRRRSRAIFYFAEARKLVRARLAMRGRHDYPKRSE
jgi:hypothetical protein